MRQRRNIIGDEHDLGDEFVQSRKSIHSISFLWGIGLLFYLLLIFGVVHWMDNAVPVPLTISDEKKYPDSFIAERAVTDLKILSSYGPRVVGAYENEVLAVDFLKHKIDSIITGKHENQEIEVDFQSVSGAYYMDLLQVSQVNSYSNVQNVIVKLHGSVNSSKSILVNSHFDTFPTSPGGSDDGINVVAMLEILRKLSTSPYQYYHDIIFLFNGAEETPLQASHGFITKHKWAHNCKVVINLEACGHGGKIILFQTGPGNPWLLKYYSMVPHPYGQVAGEEIFQSGVIPSDTDFRIFRDFGGLVGMDMAFYKNGYRYHTSYDDFENIHPGSFQNVGDNILFLIKKLAIANEISEDRYVPGKMVYFDFLGKFMILYSTVTATIINSLVIILSLGAFVWCIVDLKIGNLKPIFKYVGLTVGAILGGWILSGISLVSIAYFLNCFRPMSWFAKPWTIVPLYVIPTIVASTYLLNQLNYENLDVNIRSQVQTHVTRLIWTCILLIGTILEIRSMYAIMVPILFNSMAFYAIYIFGWQRTVRKWQNLYLISLVIPTILLMYQMLITFSLFIPLTGRMGSDKNSELIVGGITVFFTLLIISAYATLITLLQEPKYFFRLLGVIFTLCFILILTPMGFPYSEDSTSPAPQRQWITHTKRLIHDETGNLEKIESGLFFLNMDRNSPSILKGFVKDLRKSKSLDEDCDNLLVCGLPLSHARLMKSVKYSTWVPAPKPIIRHPLNFIVNSKKMVNSTYMEYNITLKGSDRMSVYIKPKPNLRIVNVNIHNSTTFFSSENKMIFISFTSGVNPGTMSFTFGVNLPEYHNGTTCQIAIASNYVHYKTDPKTSYFANVLSQLPKWVDVVAYLGTYSLYSL